jgi:ParB-like chromosome segregation protein Spo0J
VAQIAASIREFGFTNPVLIDADSGIIAGHGRVMAARKLGMDAVPCLRLGHLSDTQKRAYIIADNKLALNSTWDEELLRLELTELHGEEYDMGLLGFSATELTLAMGFEEMLDAPESSSKEIDPDDYNMGHKCPKCGFEFDAKT